MQDQTSQFGKVAVLMGGWAAERPVSLKSGEAVLKGLLASGVDAHGVDVGRGVLRVLEEGSFDRVFNVLHGRGGEDGAIQGALDILKIPYTGSGIMASALSMDKLMTKSLWRGMGLDTPEYRILDDNSDFPAIAKEMGLPLIVKPALEGSSIGMSKVNEANQLQAAYELAKPFGQVFVEQWITGQEYTASILGDTVLPLIRVEVDADIYDYEAKYERDDTRYFCPCGLSSSQEKEVQQLSMQAFESVGGFGWGRVDLMMDESGKSWLIEVNTVPGMTSHSLVPMAAKQAGISFEQLVVRILEHTQ